jgi:hypothetical protein
LNARAVTEAWQAFGSPARSHHGRLFDDSPASSPQLVLVGLGDDQLWQVIDDTSTPARTPLAPGRRWLLPRWSTVSVVC